MSSTAPAKCVGPTPALLDRLTPVALAKAAVSVASGKEPPAN
jgi:hypothetical protein